MYQIDSTGSVGGQWSNGVPGIQSATTIDANWLNTIQAEILNVLAAANITPSKAQNNQLLLALSALFTVAAGGPFASEAWVTQNFATETQVQTAATNAQTAATNAAENYANSTFATPSYAQSVANTAQTNSEAYATSQAQSALSQAEQYTANYGWAKTNSYLSTYGMVEFPTPQATFQIQWGTLNLPENDTPTAYALPTSFNNAVLAVVISYGAVTPPTTGAVGAAPLQSNSIVVTNSNTQGGANGATFIALGY